MLPHNSIKKITAISFCLISMTVGISANADSFEGPYAGVSVGYNKTWVDEGKSKWSQIGSIDYYANQGKDSKGEGAIAGINLGYDWRINNYVIGAEVGGSSLDSSSQGLVLTYDITTGAPADPVRSRTKLKSLIVAKSKLGYVVNETTMIYGTLGIAQGRVKRTLTGLPVTIGDVFQDDGVSSSTTKSITGYTIGAGLEKSLNEQLSMKFELNFVDLGNERYKTTGTTFGTPSLISQNVEVKNTAVTFGLSYRF